MADDELEVNYRTQDAYVLFHGMFSSQLPPLLDEIITEKSIYSLIEKIEADKIPNLYAYDEEVGLISSLDNSVKSPSYIYGGNWATESIKFYTLKVDDAWRPMSVPNIKNILMFTYNSLIVAEEALNAMYTDEERRAGITSHSESAIIGRDGIFSSQLYENDLENPNSVEAAIGFIGYDEQSKFFKDSKLQRYMTESTYPFVMQIDISKFFENVYTHMLGKISEKNLGFKKQNKTLNRYLIWLDHFNQKSNDNHTKGIVQGPISSKISAELLQLDLDSKIQEKIVNLGINVQFTRYVDDYRFYAKNKTDLELIRNDLIKLFRAHELAINEQKLSIYKGFESTKQAHLGDYIKVNNLLGKSDIEFNYDEFANLRDTIILALEKEDIPTLKSILTILSSRITDRKVILLENKVVEVFLRVLIKLTYVKPILATKVFKLINAISVVSSTKQKRNMWSILFDEFDYVVENFSETDLEAWYFYCLIQLSKSDEASKIVTKVIKSQALNPIVATALLKNKSKSANKRIEKELLTLIKDEEWNSVSQSKWWLPLSKLWLTTGESVGPKVRALFRTSNGNKIAWQKLGIVEFLKNESGKN